MKMSLLLAFACHPAEPRSDGDTDAPGQEPSDTSGPSDTAGSPTEVEGFALSVDPDIVLMVHATFTDPGATEAWVEYRFEGDAWQVAPTTASGEAVILGVPEETPVEARAAAVVDGVTLYSDTATATTGSLPPELLRPEVTANHAALASSEGYAMISVATGNYTYEGPYAIEIFDRNGRVVWYVFVPDELFSFYPSVSRDGTHVWYDAQNIFGFSNGAPEVTRRTLDGRWTVVHPTPNAGQAFAEGPDGSFFYELRGAEHSILQLDAAGGTTRVWDCDAHMASIGLDGDACRLNACNWDEARGTLLASQFETSTVFEVDLATGQAIRQMGALDQGEPYRFDPPESEFNYQHWPHWTPEGTLFVSTHAPCDPEEACEHTQIAAEYVVDDATKTLTRIWSHTSTDLWATQMGEAYRLPNGNLIQGYGQDGAVREITPDGQTAWEVTWARDDRGYRVVGHVSLIADLYALNKKSQTD